MCRSVVELLLRATYVKNLHRAAHIFDFKWDSSFRRKNTIAINPLNLKKRTLYIMSMMSSPKGFSIDPHKIPFSSFAQDSSNTTSFHNRTLSFIIVFGTNG